MIDEPIRRWLSRVAEQPARVLQRLGVSPNQITIAAGGMGLAAAALVAGGRLRLGVLVWLVSRVLDGFDGLLARLSGRATLFGGYLDITLDMLAYSAMALAFVWAMPSDIWLWLAVLVGYVMAITTTLAISSLMERADRQLGGDRSLQFTPGPAEGAETTIVYVLVGLVPASSRPVLWVWIMLLALTMVTRTTLARRLLR